MSNIKTCNLYKKFLYKCKCAQINDFTVRCWISGLYISTDEMNYDNYKQKKGLHKQALIS